MLRGKCMGGALPSGVGQHYAQEIEVIRGA